MKPWMLALGLLVLVFSNSSHAEAEYRAEFFSYEPKLATRSHTFARFTKLENGRAEFVDISYLPEPEFFRGERLPRFATVPGHNYTLEDTYRMAGNRGVISNGTYSITAELFEAAKARRSELESGKFSYRMTGLGDGPYAINCIQAVSGVVGHVRTGLKRGTAATNSVVDSFLSTGHMQAVRPGAPAMGSSMGYGPVSGGGGGYAPVVVPSPQRPHLLPLRRR